MGTSRNELCKQVPRNCLLPDCSASELLRKQEKRGARAMLQEARALREGHSHQELLFFFLAVLGLRCCAGIFSR